MRSATAFLLLGSIGCSGGSTSVPEEIPTLRIGGSDTLNARLMPALLETWGRGRTDVRYEVTTEDSTAGIRGLLEGTYDVAASSRAPTPSEEEQARTDGYTLAGEARHIVGVDVVAVAVHPGNPTDSLTYDQVIGIFCSRTIDDWSFLGMDSQPIRVLTREQASGTRALFEDFFCGPRGIHQGVEVASREEIVEALKTDPTAIAFVSLSDEAGKLLGLRPDAAARPVHASQQHVIRGAYPLYRDMYLFTRGPAEDAAADLIDWIESPAGQEVVDEHRLVPLFLRPERLDEPRPLRETIHFDPGASKPNQRSMARLQLLVDELKERAGEYRHIVLEGYTDSEEGESLALARQRAETVRDLLKTEIPGLYFEIIPRGADDPIAPNETPYGRLRNRRVQIYLAAEEGGRDVVVEGG